MSNIAEFKGGANVPFLVLWYQEKMKHENSRASEIHEIPGLTE